MYTVRLQRPEDVSQVRAVNELAFGDPAEANLVERLQDACPDSLSLVAADEEGVAGHILFTPVVITAADRGEVVGMGLAPMAVRPDRQRQGVGAAMVTHGLEILRGLRCPFVVVVGHPEYYPRFGFGMASRYGLACQWDGVPEAAFMVAILDSAAMAGVSGVARYRDEFTDAG